MFRTALGATFVFKRALGAKFVFKTALGAKFVFKILFLTGTVKLKMPTFLFLSTGYPVVFKYNIKMK